MLLISKSYDAGYRVFIPRDSVALEVHEQFRKMSMWGGHDKEQEIEGVCMFGYEFSNMNKVTQALLYYHEALYSPKKSK